jgi:hypothetical protein
MMEEKSFLIIKTILKQMVDNISKNKRKKGGFKKDGSTHHSGIKNEHNIVNWLNQEESSIGQYLRPSNTFKVQHKGGTQCKADAVIINSLDNSVLTTLSIKNHKTGTFDWLNSTKGFPDDLSTWLKEKTKVIKANYLNHQNLDICREEIDTLFSSTLSDLKSNHDFIQMILESIYQKYTDGILINIEKEQTLVYFEKKELKELQANNDSSIRFSLKHNPGTCSASIIKTNINTLEETNTNLRIRLVLNNGVNALVGTSLKNKCSVPCIKIQQDQVDTLIHSIENKKIEKYNNIK